MSKDGYLYVEYLDIETNNNKTPICFKSDQYYQNISDDDYARDLFAWYSQPQSDEQRVNVNATELSHMYDRVNEWVEDYQLLLTNGDDLRRINLVLMKRIDL